MSVENKTDANWEPNIVAFTCNWCTYAGADLAGLNRLPYAPNVRLIRVPCSGRIDPQFVLRALKRGADGVLVSGCHPADCHYGTGNYYARRRHTVMKNFLEYIGLEPERYQTSWISGSEAQKFADTVNDVVEGVKRVGPNRKLRDEK